MQRLAWTDNLRALMIIFVVMMHAAVTYGGIGGWYYIENEKVDMGSTIFFAVYQSFSQAYFMSLLFLFSGYFTRKSLLKKGTLKFLSGRFYRLGIPLLIYIFILHPLNVKMAYPDLELWHFYKHGIIDLRLFSWTGPMWFVEALLIFSLIYVMLRKIPLIQKKLIFKLNAPNLSLLILFITAFAFGTRLIFPIGTDVVNLQLCYFPAYIVMFFTGIIAHSQDIFNNIDYRTGIRWLIISFAIGLPAWFLIIIFGGPLKGIMLIEGGLNWPAFFYALWESFFCVAFITALIGIFRHRYNNQNRFQKFLSDNAFGVYVFHATILIGISVILKDLTMPPVPKFFMVFSIAIVASYLFSWLIRKIPVAKILFS